MSNYTRLNLAGQHLRIALNPVPPLHIGESRGDQYHLESGSDYEFISLMSHYFNFTSSLIDQKGEWGQNSRNGSYSGLIGSVASGQCHLGMGVSIRNKADRRGALIDLTHPYLQARITFVTLKNEPIPLRGVLMMPFSWLIWMCVALTVVVLMICGRVFVLVSSEKVFLDLDWLVFSALLQQAPLYRKKANTSTHLLIQLSWMAGFILLAAYGGAIISSLTATLKVKNLDTLHELTELTEKKKLTPLMIGKASYMKDFEKYRNISPPYDSILRHMKTVPNVREGFDLMVEERLQNPKNRYALIYPYPMIKVWCDKLGSKYFYLNDNMESSIFTDNYAIAFRVGSSLVPHFDRFIKLAHEHGFFCKWHRQHYQWSVPQTGIIDTLKKISQRYVFETKLVNYQDLGVLHLQEHLDLLAGGLAVATLALALEIGVFYWKTSKKSIAKMQVKQKNCLD